MSINIIKTFEYSSLVIGTKYKNTVFQDYHFKTLVKYNDRHGNKFFTVGYNKITFSQYVGVIRVDDLTIEILPKIDKNNNHSEDENKWQNVLLRMLKVAGILKINSMTDACLKRSNRTILDFYIEHFLNEVNGLVHEGLVKKYRMKSENQNSLKGRLNIPKNISKNIVHKERFHVTFTNYDKSNVFNGILKKALIILKIIVSDYDLRFCINRLLHDFDDIHIFEPNDADFKSLQYDRKTARYEEAMKIAKMIILNYSPDLVTGTENVLAILFDMNVLFERYIYRVVKKESGDKYTVSSQTRKSFWGSKNIYPDIIMKKNDDNTLVILDTKWKIPDSKIPADSDLKQMFVYNEMFDCKKAFLVYPSSDTNLENIKPINFNNKSHSCGMIFADVIGQNEIINFDIL